MSFAVIALVIVLATSAGEAHAPRAFSASQSGRLSTVLRTAAVRTRLPAATAAIVEDGKVVWAGATGRAIDVRGIDAVTGRRTARRSVRARPGTAFSVASLSKMYTAALVLRLVEEARVGLDDPIARWVPAGVPGASRVTVRMLLAHTSGYPDVEGDEPLARQLDISDPAFDPARRWSRDRILARQRRPHFTPGSRYEYSNSNYLLLGDVLERAAHATPDRELRRVVTGPVGLTATTYADRPGLAARMAHGYERFGHAYNDHWSRSRTLPTDLVGPVWTDGGVITTASDAARFGDALWSGRILRPATLAEMIDPGGPGRAEDYGLGTYSMRVAGRTWQGHDGDYGGYQSMLFTDRAAHLTLAVLANSDAGDVAQVFDALAAAVRPVRPARPVG